MTQTDTVRIGQEDLRYRLALHRVPGIGCANHSRLMEQFGSPRAVFEAGTAQLRNSGLSQTSLKAISTPDWDAVDADLDWLDLPDNHLIDRADPRYPALLGEIADPPALLFVHGNPACLAGPQLAIVGSRNPSHEGESLAREFAAYLAACGLTITSGLATGIDGAAHDGALAGGGDTIAVTGTGLDRVYPSTHRELAHRIAKGGALVSEFSPGTPPVATNFPRRNRIISGLSLGTLVVEAALRSGSLITARLALEQGREVFAIPGSIHNPLARGCHALIRQGAKLVETGEHILEELAPMLQAALDGASPPAAMETPQESGKLAGEYQQLIDYIGHHPVSVDQLVERSGLTPEEVSSMLLVLELDDYLVAGPGGRYTRAK